MKSSRNPTTPSAVVRNSTSSADAVIGSPVSPCDDEVADPDRDQDRDAAHRRRAALGLVALRALVADLLAEALPREEPDQVRGEQDRDRERHARGDEDAPHATGSRVGVQQRGRQPVQPGRAGGLDQHDVAGRQLGAQQLERRVGDVRDRAARRRSSGAPTVTSSSTPSRRRRAATSACAAADRRRRARPSGPSTAQVRRLCPAGRGRRHAPAPAAPRASTPGSRCRRR